MNDPQLTMWQSIKLLWSYMWRGWLLMMPLGLLMCVVMFKFVPFPKPGEPPAPPDLKMMPLFFVVWLVMMIGGTVLQALAMRWAVKAKWSDFRLVVVPVKDEA